MSKKKIQKPFNLEAWENGVKVETRDGRQVRILCTDAKHGSRNRNIIGLKELSATEECVMSWNADGHSLNPCDDDNSDLVLVEEVEELERWAEDNEAKGEGWYIDNDSNIHYDEWALNFTYNYNVFATEKQAKSALAMARISQLMAHDERYGGVVTDEEWKDTGEQKYIIVSLACGGVWRPKANGDRHFLAFHTAEQRDLFLAENEQLIKDYLMID